VRERYCTFDRNGTDCKCGCSEVPVRLECTECGEPPLVCVCSIGNGDAWFRVIRIKDGSVANDL
jgi:hypothetical protein